MPLPTFKMKEAFFPHWDSGVGAALDLCKVPYSSCEVSELQSPFFFFKFIRYLKTLQKKKTVSTTDPHKAIMSVPVIRISNYS